MGNTKKITASQEDYLEAIYILFQENQAVKAIEISKYLGVGRSSVTEALQNLAGKNLVNYSRYDSISLTKEGEKKAREVALKHQILYKFLTQILEIPSEEAHENACKIEHVISDNVFKKLTMLVELNKPKLKRFSECKKIKLTEESIISENKNTNSFPT